MGRPEDMAEEVLATDLEEVAMEGGEYPWERWLLALVQA